MSSRAYAHVIPSVAEGSETVACNNGIVQKRRGVLAVVVPDRSLARRSRGTGMAGGGSGAASRPCPMGTGCPRYDESQGVVGGRGRPACPLVPRSGSGKTNKAWVPDRSPARRSRGSGMAGGGSGAASRPCPMGTGCPRYDESQGVVGGRGRLARPLVPRSESGKTK